MRVLTLRVYEVYCAKTHTQTHAVRPHVCHADPACFASLLGSHEQHVLTEGRSSRRTDLRRGWMPRKSAAGGTDERRRGSERQDSGGACPDLFGWGLHCTWGGLLLGWGFSWSKKRKCVWKHDQLLESTEIKQRDSTTHLAEEMTNAQSQDSQQKTWTETLWNNLLQYKNQLITLLNLWHIHLVKEKKQYDLKWFYIEWGKKGVSTT